jgi:signal transduction histidine kinase
MDRGPGIDPSRAQVVFDEFYTTKPDGLGLGLSISRSIIDAHGGRLWIDTGAAPGATFRFTLSGSA